MRSFEAFHIGSGLKGFEVAELPALPAIGTTLGEHSASGESPTPTGSPSPAGPGILSARLSAAQSRTLLESLRQAAVPLRSMPASALVRALGEVGARFADPSDPLRGIAEERLPLEAGLSPENAAQIIQNMARDWTADRLNRLLHAEFPDPHVLKRFRADGAGGETRAFGGSLAFHIGAGNVPGVGVTSIMRSLLVRCPVLLKPGSGDLTLPCLFARGLLEADSELARAVAVVYWPGGSGSELEEIALSEADRVVAYGGTSLVTDLRARLPATTPLVAYHHRLSLGAVARELLAEDSTAKATAAAAAESVSVFDQQGCVSPRIIWVEEGGTVRPIRWAELLAQAMESVGRVRPAGPPGLESAAALRQLEGTARVIIASGNAPRVFDHGPACGAVVYDPDPGRTLALPARGRVVLVRPIDDLQHLVRALRPFGRVLQTLAMAVPEPRRQVLAETLAPTGLTRLCSFEEQPWPPPWWLHDGRGPLRALVRWIELDRGG